MPRWPCLQQRVSSKWACLVYVHGWYQEKREQKNRFFAMSGSNRVESPEYTQNKKTLASTPCGAGRRGEVAVTPSLGPQPANAPRCLLSRYAPVIVCPPLFCLRLGYRVQCYASQIKTPNLKLPNQSSRNEESTSVINVKARQKCIVIIIPHICTRVETY
jgi:hypothetical protein